MYYIIFGLYIAIGIFMIKNIISNVFFIKPMRKKYDILINVKLGKEHKVEIFVILFYLLVLLVTMITTLYFLNKIFFYIIVLVYIGFGIYYLFKYKKYDILQYINWYSVDLYDWNKIYNLNIDEDIKKECFEMHNLNYDNYKK